ncbi:MAG: PHB depolymerase family esterase [Myxococcota bacterium]
MHRLATLALLWATASACTPPCATQQGSQACRVRGPEGWRPLSMHVPSTDADTPTPLVLNLHGGGGSGASQEIESEMTPFAEEHGFIVVYPTAGKAADGKHRWNSGPRTTEGRQSTADDVAYLKAVIDEMERLYAIDTARIYVTGLSNGAQMAYRFACEAEDRVAATAPVAGAMVIGSCTLDQPMPMLLIHGTADAFVPYEGGPSDPALGEAGVDEDQRPIPETAALWAELDGCASTPEVTFQQGEATCQTWRPCSGGAEVQLCTIDGGGHNWPGSEAYPVGASPFGRALASLVADHWPGHVTQDLRANEAVWSFFQRFERSPTP